MALSKAADVNTHFEFHIWCFWCSYAVWNVKFEHLLIETSRFVLIDQKHNADRHLATLILTNRQLCSERQELSFRAVMPLGVLGQSPLPLTYPKQLNKVAHISAPAFAASRPKQLLPRCRMSFKGQAATSAVRDNGASYPSTAGPGSQRALVNTLAASSICMMKHVHSRKLWSMQPRKLPKRTRRPWWTRWTLSSLTATVGLKVKLARLASLYVLEA